MYHKLFDNVYVINLKRSDDRRKSIKEQLWRIGCKYEMFEATDGHDLDIEIDEENKLMDGWTKGSNGLVDTTIRIIRDAKEKGYKDILILEDDIIFAHGDTRLIKRIKDYNWELIHLAAHDYRRAVYMCDIRQLRGAWSCQAYAVNSNIYDEYLDWLELRNRPIDWITSNVFHTRGKSYAPVKNIIITKPNLSTIRDAYVDYRL